MLQNEEVKITMYANKKEVKSDDIIVYTINIINQLNQDVRDIILDIHIPQEISFMNGEIQRRRGALAIEGQYTDLTIGNLAPQEEVTIILTTHVKDYQIPTQIKSRGIVRFSMPDQTNRLEREASVKVEAIEVNIENTEVIIEKETP